MRVPVATMLLLAAWIGAARAELAMSSRDVAAIQSVITSQVDAFRHDDAGRAFSYAAPSTQGVFGTAQNFLDMVRRGYQPVYRPRAMEFAALAQDDAGIVQSVELTGPDGLFYTARYTMEREADGSWRIVACALLQSRRLGV